jgi:Mg-chelatase subunit ChlD
MKYPVTVLLAVLLLASTVYAQEGQTEKPEEKRPVVEVVFVLDTTGSMSGLIEGAKQKIWSIVNHIADGEPTPDIKVGIVGYRDKGDKYVTKLVDLSDDLDEIFKKLKGFKARGGGDTPESVNQGLYEAVTKVSWSTDDKTLRVIFLVGDCPPHMDYKDDVKYQETCKKAVKKDIIINTVQCGSHGATTPIWQEIAKLGEGVYVQIAQSGGMVAVSTPIRQGACKAQSRA